MAWFSPSVREVTCLRAVGAHRKARAAKRLDHAWRQQRNQNVLPRSGRPFGSTPGRQATQPGLIMTTPPNAPHRTQAPPSSRRARIFREGAGGEEASQERVRSYRASLGSGEKAPLRGAQAQTPLAPPPPPSPPPLPRGSCSI